MSRIHDRRGGRSVRAALALLGGVLASSGATAGITGVCPDGSIFIVRKAAQIPCKGAKRVDPSDVPPVNRVSPVAYTKLSSTLSLLIESDGGVEREYRRNQLSPRSVRTRIQQSLHQIVDLHRVAPPKSETLHGDPRGSFPCSAKLAPRCRGPTHSRRVDRLAVHLLNSRQVTAELCQRRAIVR